MAIPVYERREGIAPLPGARVQAAGDPNAYGAGVGSAVTNMAEASMKLLNDREDAATLEAYNNYKRDLSLYHNEPNKGVLNRQGKNTIGLYQEADKWMQNKAEEYVKKMKSPRMVKNFRRMAGEAIVSQGEHNSRYEAQQFRKYQTAEAEATIEMAIDDAVANWQDDGAAEASRQRAIQALELKLRGQSHEVWKNELAELDSRMAMGRLGRMIEADPVEAKKWYEKNENKILGTDRAKAVEAIRLETERREREATSEAERLEREQATERIWETYYMDEQAGTDAIDNDPNLSFEQKNKVKGLYQARVADQRRFDEKEERDWFQATRNQVANAGSLERAMAAIEYSRADGWTRTQLEGIAAQIYKPETFQEDIRDWHQAYKEVTSGQLATADDFLYRWNGILSSDSLKSMVRLFYGSGSGGAGGKISYLNDGTEKTMAKAMNDLNIIEGSQAQATFSTLIGEAFDAKEKEQKRPLSPLEKYAIIQEYAKDRVLLDLWPTDITRPEYEVRMAERLGFTFDEQRRDFFREGPNGVERYDPDALYSPPALRPSQQSQQSQESQQSQRPPRAQGLALETPAMPSVTSAPRGPRRMPDGREIGVRARKPASRAQGESPPKTGQDFIEEIKPGILEVANEIDVPPSVLMAQAILESRWGKSRIGNNIFGVKAGRNWTGATRNARTAAGDATFRDYDSVEDSIQDLGRVLSADRYANLWGASDYKQAAQALQNAGYAGNESDYAAKLIKIIEQYKLYELDEA